MNWIGSNKLCLAPLCALVLLVTNGCISVYVVKQKARPHVEFDAAENKARQVEGEPGYYALLPLTIAADVVTSPFQIIYFGDSHSGMMTIDGWPVPLP